MTPNVLRRWMSCKSRRGCSKRTLTSDVSQSEQPSKPGYLYANLVESYALAGPLTSGFFLSGRLLIISPRLYTVGNRRVTRMS